MKKHLYLPVSLFLSLCAVSASAQDIRTWTLSDCIGYALENNIGLRQSRNNYRSGLEDLEQAKAALYPTLSASSSQGVNTAPTNGFETAYSGSYNRGSNMTLYNGGRLRSAIRQGEIDAETDSLSVLQSADDLRISLIQAYIQCLYAEDHVAAAENTVEASQKQRDRAYEMWKAGSISKVDFSQLESQLFSDKYRLTSAQVSLDNSLLQLKQMLELDITEEIRLKDASLGMDDVLTLLPPKEEVYAAALDYMPQMKISQLDIAAAELSEVQAKANGLPSVSLSAGLGTGNRSGAGVGFGSQLWNNVNGNLGVSLSVPIIDGRKTKTAVNKARIALENSRLSEENSRKQVLRSVESTYLDAISAQAQYTAAVEKARYALQSYELTQEQFNVGMKNTVELITAQNEYVSAKQAEIQAGYTALISRMVLDVYQGKPIR